MKPIGWVNTPFPEKFGIPRQPGLVDAATGTLHLHPEFAYAGVFDGLEEASHLWLVFLFHAQPADWSPKVRPPRLGGNRKVGVFACRSPRRPNPIGLSVVRLLKVEGLVLHLAGLDLLDQTPILDIKPYLPYTDAVAGAEFGLASAAPAPLDISFEKDTARELQELGLLELAMQVLAQDPRPAYHQDNRSYGTTLRNTNVRWRVEGEKLYITGVEPL